LLLLLQLFTAAKNSDQWFGCLPHSTCISGRVSQLYFNIYKTSNRDSLSGLSQLYILFVWYVSWCYCLLYQYCEMLIIRG